LYRLIQTKLIEWDYSSKILKKESKKIKRKKKEEKIKGKRKKRRNKIIHITSD